MLSVMNVRTIDCDDCIVLARGQHSQRTDEISPARPTLPNIGQHPRNDFRDALEVLASGHPRRGIRRPLAKARSRTVVPDTVMLRQQLHWWQVQL